MKVQLIIPIILMFSSAYGQRPNNIRGRVVDERGNIISSAALHYRHENGTQDTSYTDEQGRFSISYPTQQTFCSFYIEKSGFLPKRLLVDISSKDVFVKKPIILRSRTGFWYDTKKIDSTHIGITVRDAIGKYKLDITQCFPANQRPGPYIGFSTELADSSEIFFSIKSFFSEKIIKIEHILDLKIIGFGIADTNGNEKVIGIGRVFPNRYFTERLIYGKPVDNK